MLEFLLASRLGIGSNRRRDTTASSVVALLPELGPGRFRAVGEVPPPYLQALAAVGLEPGDGDLALVVVGPGAGGAPEGDGSVPQLWVGGRPSWLPPDAVAGMERGGPAPAIDPRSSGPRALALPFAPRAETSASPVARVQRVVGRARRRLPGAGRVRPGSDAAERGVASALYGAGPPPAAPAATVVLPAGRDAMALPPYLRRRLDAAGITSAGATWRLLADGEYPSQKLAWFLSSGVIVKLGREGAFSPRLHNEHAALRRLADAGIARPGLPVPLLDDDVHDLALVAEGAVAGEPFSRHGRNEPGDPVLAAAFDEVLAVTTAPALRSVAGVDEVARDLGALNERFAAAYGRSTALDGAVTALAETPQPTTLQHGDPGTWNLLVAGDGTIAVLDWENAEARGLPVADALFFAAGVARRALDASGRRPTPEAIVDRLLTGGSWADWTRDVVGRAAAVAGCDPARIPDLVLVGAAYQAVKEVPRLDPAAPARGEWVRLLAALAPVRHRFSG